MPSLLTEAQLSTVKDALLMRWVVSQGGEVRLGYEELERIGMEYHGYTIYLLANEAGMTLRVRAPEEMP